MSYAPIALFIYNRPEHSRRTIEALQRCPEFKESPVFVFSDGPRKAANEPDVLKARAVARTALEGHANFSEAPTNRGLARSIISGVSRLCEEFGRVIVVEDDLVVSPQFLTYMNAALDRYSQDERIMQISGYMFPITAFSDRTDAFFLPFTTSWGWATWARAWKHFDATANGWERLEQDASLRHRFNLHGSFDYFHMLKLQLAGAIDSWAIRWYWSVFIRDGFVLYPPKSLVQNTGFDGSGTHGWRTARNFDSNEERSVTIPELPKTLMINRQAFVEVQQVLRHARGGSARRVLRFFARHARKFAKAAGLM